MTFVFLLLRIVRGAIDLCGGMNLLTSCSHLANAAEVGVLQLIVAFLCLIAFASLRWIINRLHIGKFGVPHPALAKDWNL